MTRTMQIDRCRPFFIAIFGSVTKIVVALKLPIFAISIKMVKIRV